MSVVPSPEPSAERTIDFFDVVRFLTRQWRLIGGGAAAAGVLTALVLVISPARYEASATLVVVPLKFKSQLQPSVLPLQGYQRLLESDAVLAEATRRLREDGVLGDEAYLRLGRNVETRIFVSRRAEETILAPVIEAVGYSGRPEDAAASVNTWVDVFLEHTGLLFDDSLTPTLQLIESQYEKERGHLATLEGKLVEMTAGHEQRIYTTIQRWDRRITEASNETEDLLTAHHAETRRLMLAAASPYGLGIPETAAGSAHGPEGVGADEELVRSLAQILAVRVQLAQTPRLLVLERAIPDDSLWQLIASGHAASANIDPVLTQKLHDEEVNPVYAELTLRLSQLEVALPSIASTEAQRVQEFTTALERLQHERNTDLMKLMADRALLIDDLERQRTLEVEALGRERDTETNQLRRDIGSQSDLYRKLSANYNEATLARAEQGGLDVRLGSRAVSPTRQDRNLALKALVAAVLGGFFGLLGGMVREWALSARPTAT